MSPRKPGMMFRATSRERMFRARKDPGSSSMDCSRRAGLDRIVRRGQARVRAVIGRGLSSSERLRPCRTSRPVVITQCSGRHSGSSLVHQGRTASGCRPCVTRRGVRALWSRRRTVPGTPARHDDIGLRRRQAGCQGGGGPLGSKVVLRTFEACVRKKKKKMRAYWDRVSLSVTRAFTGCHWVLAPSNRR